MKLFLTSDDYVDFEIVRYILKYRHIFIEGIEALEVITDIPLTGQNYGLGDFDPNTFYLINRHNNSYLHDLNTFPIAVRVYIINEKGINDLTFNTLQQIAWAEVYDNFNDADESLKWVKDMKRKGYISSN